MKIVIAPDSFKESVSAFEAAQAIAMGFREVFPEAEIETIPMADGGEGTVEALVHATGGQVIKKWVTGPLGEPVEAFFGLLGDGKTAVIEMAAASGLHLAPKGRRTPLFTTTRGTGELIREALDFGVEQILIGIGGSATVDGGVGMIQALGGRFLNKNGDEIGPGGGHLSQMASIDLSELDPRLKRIKFTAACDVENPLTGPTGAAAVFGPQKGATPEMVQILDENLSHYANLIQHMLGREISRLPGSGAAGGLGAGLIAFLNARLKPGVEIVLDLVHFDERVEHASLVITGEGRIDGQTIYGKTPIGVAKAAKKYHIPVIALAGSLSEDSHRVLHHGIDALYCILPGIIPLEEALNNGATYLAQTARNIAMTLKLGKNLPMRN
ncbi:MAG: glycerate kinase [Thermicanus sp.]|nr:glycerate kinase [Thermicanus sp.]